MKTLSLIATTALLAANTAFAAPSTLKFDVYNADGNSFNVNSTVVYGDTEAMVVDAGFTKADALRIAAKVMDSGKERCQRVLLQWISPWHNRLPRALDR